MEVNKVKDFIERVGWTAIQVAAGALLDQLVSGEVSWRAIGYAAAIAALKVFIAQRAGDNNDGAAIPGGIREGS